MYMFGNGSGHLSAKIARIAEEHGAELVNFTDPECKCGWGCKPFECKASQRHWFTCANYGEPHDSNIARAVLAAIDGQR